MAERHNISLKTPEGIALQFQLGGLIERSLAFSLDMAYILGALLALFALTFVFGVVATELGIVVLLLGFFVLRHGYFTFFEVHWQGSTPGKRALGLRVLSRDGAGLTVDAVFARNLLRDVELFVPAAALAAPEQVVGAAPWWLTLPALCWVGVLTMVPLLTRERTRAGDLVAGTVVVHVPDAELLSDMTAWDAGEIQFSQSQLRIYGEHELETLSDVLHKAHGGEIDEAQLSVIATTIAGKIGYTGPEPQSQPLRFLAAFYARQRAALEKRLLFGDRKASKDS